MNGGYKLITGLAVDLPTLLKNMSSSDGVMKFWTESENKFHVPNHQSDIPWDDNMATSTSIYTKMIRKYGDNLVLSVSVYD